MVWLKKLCTNLRFCELHDANFLGVAYPHHSSRAASGDAEGADGGAGARAGGLAIGRDGAGGGTGAGAGAGSGAAAGAGAGAVAVGGDIGACGIVETDIVADDVVLVTNPMRCRRPSTSESDGADIGGNELIDAEDEHGDSVRLAILDGASTATTTAAR